MLWHNFFAYVCFRCSNEIRLFVDGWRWWCNTPWRRWSSPGWAILPTYVHNDTHTHTTRGLQCLNSDFSISSKMHKRLTSMSCKVTPKYTSDITSRERQTTFWFLDSKLLRKNDVRLHGRSLVSHPEIKFVVWKHGGVFKPCPVFTLILMMCCCFLVTTLFSAEQSEVSFLPFGFCTEILRWKTWLKSSGLPCVLERQLLTFCVHL